MGLLVTISNFLLQNLFHTVFNHQISRKKPPPQKKKIKVVKDRGEGADLQKIHELDIVLLFQRFFAIFFEFFRKVLDP